MPYSKKQKRLYGRVISGMTRAGAVRLMTLTSSPLSPTDIHRSFCRLKEMIRRRGGFEYVAVTEVSKSGLLHLHIVFRGGFLPQAWLSYQWNRIHVAPVVWISAVHQKKGVAVYLAKYLGKQESFRVWYSWGWIYRGWRFLWNFFWKTFARGGGKAGWLNCLRLWSKHLKGEWVWLSARWIPPPLVTQIILKRLRKSYGRGFPGALW